MKLVLGLVLLMALVACSSDAEPATTTTAPTTSSSATVAPSTSATTSSTLVTTTTTLAVEVPEEWTEIAPNEYELPALAGGLAATLVTTEVMGEGSIDDIADHMADMRAELVREFEVLSQGSRQIGSREARYLEYAGVDQGNVARYELWVDIDGSVLHITYAASVEAYSRSKAEFESFVDDLVG